jgi:hypothetical protein
MTLEDRLLIEDVIGKYSYAYDRKDAEAFASLFADDAIFEVIVPGHREPIVKLVSRLAIRDWAAQRHLLTAGTQARHFQTGLVFDEFTAEAARTRTMLLLTRQRAADTIPIVELTGIYSDSWRKMNDRWILSHRTAHLDRDPGFGSTVPDAK